MTDRLRAALFAVLWLSPVCSRAAIPEAPTGMTVPQFQGVSCLGGGALGSLVAYTYTDALVLTGAVTINPLVILGPALATGFAVGCSIAANAAPGLFWLSTKFR
jgi:hypothetical protein